MHAIPTKPQPMNKIADKVRNLLGSSKCQWSIKTLPEDILTLQR
jgi:hypothetical protein